MIIIKLVVALLWAIIGLFIWIPILFRVMFFYVFNISYLTVMERDIIANNHLTLLINTFSIYRNGFENIFREADVEIIRARDKNPKREIWGELLWSLFFWGTIISPFIKWTSLFTKYFKLP